VNRREILPALAGAAATPCFWPHATRAQQPAVPVVGVLTAFSPEQAEALLPAFRRGLGEFGYVENRNVTFEYRFASNDVGRGAELAADLVRRRVAVIAVPGSGALALAVKAATTIIPVVFTTSGDPVQIGLVASLNRPGGNVTGASFMNSEIGLKRLSLLHELLPAATRFAAFVDRNDPVSTVPFADLGTAATSAGLAIEPYEIRTSGDIDRAFADFRHRRAEGVLVPPMPLLLNRRVQVLTLAARHALPAIYPAREWAVAGGLMSYGSSLADQFFQAGVYTGRILKDEKPPDLPVMRATKFELVINLQVARALEIAVPPTLLALADEVIE
jgi:putative tryptophan/tyrosine transport system substrate-binding protein